ncbi:MAG: hypothetical protein CMO13_04895 [Thaumarchaeota archaeon]|nr:hypothetical protein [Nitrososphaerota archaeon]|tara:strand:+ start:1860 stop:2597 length:738 start_codon:yes stop_codon:yes gene_type:complete
MNKEIFTCKIELLVLDLDGTVFGSSRLLIEEIEKIRQLTDTGVRIIISSGRTLHYVLGIVRCLGINDIVICEEGTIIYDCRNDNLLVNGNSENIAILKENLSSWLPFCIIPREAHHDKNIILALDRNPRIDVDDFVNEVSDVLSEKNLELNITRSDEMINILPLEIDKGIALTNILKSENINPETVVAIGDSLNDLSTFDSVAYPIAVSNAHELVKKKSVYVSPQKNGLGVCDIIDMILSNNEKY